MNTTPKRVILKSGRTAALGRRHPWVFSGAIERVESGIEPGDTVLVSDSAGNVLATGHYSDGSIAVKVLDFQKALPDAAFWSGRLRSAFSLRQHLGLTQNPATNAYRLVHAEGDGLPGLIVDIYGAAAVLQFHSLGMRREREVLVGCLKELYGPKLETIFDKSDSTLDGGKAEFIVGSEHGAEILENNLRYKVDWVSGQKTGFFLDQRNNRALLQGLAQGRAVLNAFSYSGGFSVAALAGGALSVDSVDESKGALALAGQNIERNFPGAQHRETAADCFQYLRDIRGKYDLIVLDPPAFAKHRKDIDAGLRGYREINRLAFEQIRPGGLVFTFSCSQMISRQDFREVVFSAAAQSGREVRITHQLCQGPDHPVSVYHPEGEYLKGLVLEVG